MVTAHESWVALDRLRPNPWNPNAMDDFMFQKELESIRKFGFVSPIIVRSVPDGIEIVDGEHRWNAARQLGLTRVPIWDIGRISDVDAKELTVVLNETRGKADPAKLSALLKDLLTSETTASLLSVLPFTTEAFNQLAELPAFDWDQLESAVLNPRAGSSWVERTYRMPREVANVIDEAVHKARTTVKRELNDDLTDWQALEVIAAEYLTSL
jgi:hypothetical protein